MRYPLLLVLCAMIVTPIWASDQLDQANAKFTYKGQSIHPYLVKEFSNWLSDNRPPMITTVDVSAAFDTNRYMLSDVQKRDDWWFVEKKGTDGDIGTYESYNYRWLGKMANGIHVVETSESGGGSGIFMDLMFIRFSEGEIMWENKKEKQLLMSIVGTYTLGDRDDGKIKVLTDRVIIGKSRYRDVILTFP